MTVSIFPAGNTLPSIAGQAGNFLGTDGTSINWLSSANSSRLVSGSVSTNASFTNLNAKNSIFLILGNSSNPGGINITFNRNSQNYSNVFAAWNGSSSGQTETNLNANTSSIYSGSMFSSSPAIFMQIEGVSSNGPKLLRGWSQDGGSNNMWAGVWNNPNPINSITLTTSNGSGFTYRMVIQ